ncbi:hypothetical protein MHU86_13084 [Fragilaria crotonensis]|nr:hypothetical protein MHU86_13084 [Fragilaria crotonensis]
MFRDSTYQYILDDEDQERLIVETENFEKEQDVLSQQQRIATAIDEATPPAALPVEPPPTRTPIVATQRQLSVNDETTQSPFPAPSTPLSTPRESPPPATPAATSPPRLIQDLQPPSPTQLFKSPLRPASHDIPSPASIETHDEIEAVTRQAPNEQQRHSPRRSTRTRKAPDRLGYDGQQGERLLVYNG